MGRQPCCDKLGLRRGPWTIDEDNKLITFILNNGIQCWRTVPKLAGLLRCGKSCRLRWINYLRPDLKRGNFTEVEENQIIQLHSRLGNRWSRIASHFSGRTDNEIKNHWNTKLKKKLSSLGIDPLTHDPILQTSTIGRHELVDNLENKSSIQECFDGIGTICSTQVTINISSGLVQGSHYSNSTSVCSLSEDVLSEMGEDSNNHCRLQNHWMVDGNLNPMVCWENWDSLRGQDEFFNF